MGPLGQGLLDPSGVTVVGKLKQGLVSIAPYLETTCAQDQQKSTETIKVLKVCGILELAHLHDGPSLCLGVDICPRLNKQLGGIEVAEADGQHQRRASLRVPRLHINSNGINEQ